MHATFLDNLLRSLSWTFIHSLWQGLILTILAGMVMLATKKRSPSLRYVLLCSLFFLFLGSAAITFFIEWNAGTTASSGLTFIAHQPDLTTLFQDSLISQIFEKTATILNANAGWIVFSWLIILLIKAGKMMLDLRYIHRLKNHRLYTPGDAWTIRIESFCKEMGIRKKVALVESALVNVPIVVGHLKPIVLVPVGILANLPAAEVEAVLLHELAHIRRHDYLVNFIQRITELLFFFNPALLWISSLLRIERENCCDDIAIAKTKNKLQFVEALIRFKEHSLKHQEYALGLFGKKNLLLQRMSRIVYNRNGSLSRVEGAFFVLSFIILLLLIPGLKRAGIEPKGITTISTIGGESSRRIAVDPDTVMQPLKGQLSSQQARRRSVKLSRQVENANPGTAELAEPRKNLSASIEYVTNGRLKASSTTAEKDKDLSQNEQSSIPAASVKKQIAPDRQEIDNYKDQWERDRIQAQKDREIAIMDREQAQKDRARAELDRQQAEKDRKQAELDRKQAQRDRELAEKERMSRENKVVTP